MLITENKFDINKVALLTIGISVNEEIDRLHRDKATKTS
jgi:hypothetical protein